MFRVWAEENIKYGYDANFFCTRNDLHILHNLIQHLDACHTSMLLRKNLQILFRVGRSNKIEKSSLNNLMDLPCYLQAFMSKAKYGFDL